MLMFAEPGWLAATYQRVTNNPGVLPAELERTTTPIAPEYACEAARRLLNRTILAIG